MFNKNIINYFPNNQDYIKIKEPKIIKQNNQYLVQNNTNYFKNIYRCNSSNTSNNKTNNIDNRYNQENDIFDERIYFCLKKLGLSYLQSIFEKNNISFNELLVLSLKDLENLGIQKEQQILIKKFSLNYIKTASYYTFDELKNYFINNKNICKNIRTTNSVDNLSKKNEKNKRFINSLNKRKNNNNYRYINNNNYNANNRYRRYYSFSNKNDYNNLINRNNNIHLINNLNNNSEYFKRNNSPSVNIKNSKNKIKIIITIIVMDIILLQIMIKVK